MNDIVDNPYGVEIIELEAAQVPRVVDDAAYVVLNGNYAIQAGFSVAKDALAYESSDSEAAKTYVNVIAVKNGNENEPKIVALVEALKSAQIVDYINSTYDGAVVPFIEDGEELLDMEMADEQDYSLHEVSEDVAAEEDMEAVTETFDETAWPCGDEGDATGSCGTNATFELADGVLTISGTGAVNKYAFSERTSVTKAIISEGITSIGEGAFINCSALTEISLPESLTSMGHMTFAGCSELKEVTIPKGLSSCTNAYVWGRWGNSPFASREEMPDPMNKA